MQVIDLASMLAPQKKPVLDRIPVPSSRVEDVLQIIDDTAEANDIVGPHRQNWRRWAALHQMFPALKGREVYINTDNILQPMFHVVGDSPKPKVSRHIKAVFEVPDDEVIGVLNLLDAGAREQTLMARYRQWCFFQALFPDLDVSCESSAKLSQSPGEWLAIVQFYGEDEDLG